MSEREYVGDRPVVIGTAEKPVMLGFTDDEIAKVRRSAQRDREKFGERHEVEIVSTRDLKPGDRIWTGQDFHVVRDTKLQSAITGHWGLEDQCLVLWRDLPDPSQYKNQGYTALGDVVLRMLTVAQLRESR